MRRAKIVCTLGPASASLEMIKKLIGAGMNVARLNFSHGTHQDHERMFNLVQQVAAELKQPVATLLDLQGPKIRVGNMHGGKIKLTKGAEVTITTEDLLGTEELIPCTYEPLSRDLKPGNRVLLDDGNLELEVISTGQGRVRCRVIFGGELSDHKGMNMPGAKLTVAALSEKDRADLAFGVKLGVDYVAISFVRCAADIEEAKRLAPGIPLIAKIEKPEAVENFANILAVTDGVMVARGDLGVEVGPEKVPLIQKQLIEQTNLVGKLIITATQMLESMRHSPRPTRAEASDVANAILDCTDAVMLSAETASGDYPIEAVQTMDAIIRTIEESQRFRAIPEHTLLNHCENANAIAHAAVVAAHELKATKIYCLTESGATASLITEYRPSASILAFTPHACVYRRLALHWGVTPLLIKSSPSTDEMINHMDQTALAAGQVKKGENVIITMGSRTNGASDLMKIHQVV